MGGADADPAAPAFALAANPSPLTLVSSAPPPSLCPAEAPAEAEDGRPPLGSAAGAGLVLA